MSSTIDRAPAGDEPPVNYAEIEKNLAELWRSASTDDEHPLTRAALWNVVAHTDNPRQHAFASETLSRASASVPQRTIVIRADAAAAPGMSCWISANCHRVGGEKQVCSEAIAIVASGDRIRRVPPLVNALLIPDMPVAMWWVGDLPNEQEDYVAALLEPADRLIVDSADFGNIDDLELLSGIAAYTTTAPADLNWVRLEEWRIATASIFDPPVMRPRLRMIRRVRITSTTTDAHFFGHRIGALLYAAWLAGQTGQEVLPGGRVHAGLGEVEYIIEEGVRPDNAGAVAGVEIAFDDGSHATISRNDERGVVSATCDDVEYRPETVTHIRRRDVGELIVRELKRSDDDHVLLRALPLATRMALHLSTPFAK